MWLILEVWCYHCSLWHLCVILKGNAENIYIPNNTSLIFKVSNKSSSFSDVESDVTRTSIRLKPPLIRLLVKGIHRSPLIPRNRLGESCHIMTSIRKVTWPKTRNLPSRSTSQWLHYERNGVSNHRCIDCLLSRLFRRRSKKTSKLRVTGLCEGNPPVTGGFPSQRASNEENFSIWWRHYAKSSHCMFRVPLISSQSRTRKCRHLDEILITCYTASFHFDKFWLHSQWQNFIKMTIFFLSTVHNVEVIKMCMELLDDTTMRNKLSNWENWCHFIYANIYKWFFFVFLQRQSFVLLQKSVQRFPRITLL